jgi:parallel beta-helix repeat protein
MLLGWLLVGSQAAIAQTFYIRNNATGGDCASIGNWDDATKTCLLKQNVQGQIEVADNNLTLDGNGYTISAASQWSGSGILLSSRSGITLQNLIVQNFFAGIDLISSSSNIITGNTVTNNANGGIVLELSSSNNVVTGNVASFTSSGGERKAGIWLWTQCNSNIVTHNKTSAQYGVIVDQASNNNVVT